MCFKVIEKGRLSNEKRPFLGDKHDEKVMP